MSSKFGIVIVYCVRRSVAGELDLRLLLAVELLAELLSLLRFEVFGKR